MVRPSRLAAGRTVERLINFSDAVVAVAVTLLALPLVDIAGPSGEHTAWDVLAEHSGEIISFLFTFYVVVMMWLVHNRILNDLAKYDGVLLWTNTTWLVGIVLLPWFSAMYGESQSAHPSVGVLYWLVLAGISFATSIMSWHLRRRPELLNSNAARLIDGGRSARLRGPILVAYFLIIALTWQLAPDVAPWMAFGIIPISIWLRPARSDRDEEDHTATEGEMSP